MERIKSIDEWQLKEVAVGLQVPFEDLTESYRRSWRERLFTLPWQPFKATGTRLSTYGMLRREIARCEFDLAMQVGVYGPMLGHSEFSPDWLAHK